ncbi:phage tail tube protein [Nocardia arthritidis]|uniref:Phage tail protein n=1 Tax=Nocardia arthritidis TaxID=228602 RepID=A0A6G9YKJ0_9NOCA|nr:hypothetical protein [Nocardia arthritidis]QIS13587.1 hypothetical protein F5544_28680 [Nocardia arthritidis]
MAIGKINARDFIIEIANDNSDTPAGWTTIHGLTSAIPNLGDHEQVVETTTFDSAGNYEQEIVQRGASIALEGFRLVDPVTGVPDQGQAKVEALAGQVGTLGLWKVHFRHTADKQWKVWTATFSVGEQGGGTNDKVPWKATITRSGPSTLVNVTGSAS